ncbi:MAG: TetR/AcrR family transcriptional regulator [Paenibacillus sp.]|jgi:AcrR family transcriptional regulator|nr:TetR/AcrR family transcriptional regulator [Paenibacillus sp.]
MPKKFNESEKQWIRQKLLEEGKRSFETFGLRKTSVDQLTKATGIAQGSFYLFFNSKEELFYELLLVEEAIIRDKLLQSANGEEGVTKESIRRFMMDSFRLMSENALIRNMYFEGELEQLIRKLPQELLERNFTEDQDAMTHVVRNWQQAGILKDTKPKLIVSMFRALVLLSLHKKEIGEAVYSDTIALLVQVLADGLYVNAGKEAQSP